MNNPEQAAGAARGIVASLLNYVVVQPLQSLQMGWHKSQQNKNVHLPYIICNAFQIRRLRRHQLLNTMCEMRD
jgi:hypothetical protein